MAQSVFHFGDGTADGRADMAFLLGGKGANLAEMSNLGLSVPPGFTITTEVCKQFYREDETLSEALRAEISTAVSRLEERVGRTFGSSERPLLVSVRSGAPASMPGMMDTILNLGICAGTVEALARESRDTRFAYDTYRRFIQMYGNVVMRINLELFEDALQAARLAAGVEHDTDLSAADLQDLIGVYFDIVANETGAPFPDDPRAQLFAAVTVVFQSWMTPRARTYRLMHNIPSDWGTAVNVQAMVFGNKGEDCATGVAFSRDPSTGANLLYGEYLPNAQGEDVVAGIRTPRPLTHEGRVALDSPDPSLQETMPELFAELCQVCRTLETHYRDMQDIEFTIEAGKLYLLQTRNGKRSMAAGLKIACDMVDDGLITEEEAVMRVDPESLNSLIHPLLDPHAPRTVVATGLPASPGAATGVVVFNANEAVRRKAAGESVILARTETSPEDIHGMRAAVGILTSRGGMTSHAAVVARGMGLACVCGAMGIVIDAGAGSLRMGDTVVREGEWLTIDGTSGEVMAGRMPTVKPEPNQDFQRLMMWADRVRRMRVRTNAETRDEIRTALEFGAEGIGLCRTEHMFFDAERILAMRQMIMADTVAARKAALAKILPMQTQDFVEIFVQMEGRPVTIRLLDPPLHEFLPHEDAEIVPLAQSLELPVQQVKAHIARLREQNPMMGHRGCRLLNSYPEICETQARAIFAAATQARAQHGATVVCEIMIPLVGIPEELRKLKAVIQQVATETMQEAGAEFAYSVGTMIELPRAALQAGDIANYAEFFSFGTNDLTQMTFGISRDDSANFLRTYQREDILQNDPFIRLDTDGVGELIAMAAQRGRATRTDVKLGICGEHGGDSSSIDFFESIGLDYVSCSPFRVPTARLAAAQAAVRHRNPAKQ